jgi:glycosyltransferase involved in cell wall biosynthesis
MRILVDARMYRGKMHGLARYVYCTVEAMARQRPDWLFGVLEREGSLAELARTLPNVEPVPVHSDPLTLQEHLEIPRVVQDWHPALFHTTTIAIPAGTRARLVATVPDLTPYFFPRRPLREKIYFRYFLPLVLRRARRILVYSEHTAQDLVKHLKTPRHKIAVCPLGVDPRLRTPLAPRDLEAARRAAGIPGPYFLCLANPKPHKNVSLLLAAWRQAALAAQLLLVSAPAPWLSEEVAATPGVVHRPEVAEEHLPALYQGARALVIPSLYEGFGLPAAEAMAAGTPVLAARAASLPEVVGQAGLLFDPHRPDELARLLRQVDEDEELRRQMAQRGRERARGYTWEETARLHLEAYLASLRA